MPETDDLSHLKDWVGRRQTLSDRLDPADIAAMAATLDRDDPMPRDGDPLPPAYHWMMFNPAVAARELGPDGHPRRGGFLPPVPLPRRMWAGGRLNFRAPLPIGARAERHSEIVSVDVKHGRTGTLVFVLVRHRIEGPAGLAIEEEHDIVYRDLPAPGAAPVPPQPAPADAAWHREIHPDPVLLFRYSALTFNGHRIHYDQPYVTKVEGYPGLIVHGPLIATLLLDLARRHAGRPIARFSFRAVSPLFDIAPFSVNGKMVGDEVTLWAANAEGGLAMTATASLAD